MTTVNAPPREDVHYDPRDQATINDPIPVLRALQEHAPVYWCKALRGWVITRYHDAEAVLRNEDFSADRITPFYTSQPPQRPGTDLISQLMALRDVDDALSEDEVIGTCMLFLFGGHETTTNLIGNGVRVLLAHPGEMQRLLEEPALIDSAVEEILRYDGPTGASVRLVRNSHTMHGVHLTAGERVFVMINAANRDPRAFEDPDRVDITRSPNNHLTFNYGPHFCMGAPLARLEGQVAIGEVLRRIPGITLAAEGYDYMHTMIMRGVRSMPVRIER